MNSALDDFGRHNPVFYDFLIVIDIVEEKIKRGDPLGQAAFDVIPF
jgi:hypothetical protein